MDGACNAMGFPADEFYDANGLQKLRDETKIANMHIYARVNGSRLRACAPKGLKKS